MSFVCPSIVSALDPGLCQSVDIYCERTSPALDSELVNAFTNLGFPIAAYFAWRLLVRHPNPANRGLILSLIVMMAVVGAGSFLFHTLGNRWAQWGDVIPILIFILLYLWLVLTRFFGWSRLAAALALLGFLGLTLYLEAGVPANVLWGGAMYLPTLLAIIAIGIEMRRANNRAGTAMIGAAGVFVLAFSMRTLDTHVCPVFPQGTHFLWHLINSVLLFLLTRLAIVYAPAHGTTGAAMAR